MDNKGLKFVELLIMGNATSNDLYHAADNAVNGSCNYAEMVERIMVDVDRCYSMLYFSLHYVERLAENQKNDRFDLRNEYSVAIASELCKVPGFMAPLYKEIIESLSLEKLIPGQSTYLIDAVQLIGHMSHRTLQQSLASLVFRFLHEISRNGKTKDYLPIPLLYGLPPYWYVCPYI